MDKNYKALELPKILELLAQHTCCEDSREMALTLEPKTNIRAAQTLLNETLDAHMLMAKFGVLSPFMGAWLPVFLFVVLSVVLLKYART